MKKVINIEERCRIGSLLRNLRKESGLSQRQLAERSGLSHEHICAIENGKYNVGIDTLSAITRELGFTLEFTKHEM